MRCALGGCAVTSDFELYDAPFEAVKVTRTLRDKLDKMYFVSGDDGTPWGERNSRHRPVGVTRTE